MQKVFLLFVLTLAVAGAGYWVYSANEPAEDEDGPIEWNGPVPKVTQPAVPTSSDQTTFVPTSQEVAKNDQEEVKGSTETASAICTGAKANDFDCYEKYYQNLVKTKGIAAGFSDIKARYSHNVYVQAQCHPLTHVIGRTAAEQFKTVGEAYKYGDGYCWSGYYHGVLETFIGRIGLENLPAQMDQVCAALPGKAKYDFDYYNCVHGLGHGVMAVNENELFESLEMCDHLTGGWEQQSCASGAYMENVIVDNLNHKTNYLKPDQPLYPCNASPDKYKNTCYLMQTSYMLKINGGDFKKTFEWCLGAEEEYQATCWQSLGRDASGRSTSNAAQTKATCLLGEAGAQQENCVIGAVKDFISYFHSDVQANAFCNSFEQANLKSICLNTGKNYYTLF